MALKINTYDRKELVDILTPIKGKVKEDTYLISITDPNKKAIVKTKSNILALTFLTDFWGPNAIRFTDAIDIYMFGQKIIKHLEMRTEDLNLWIQCEEGDNRSTAVAYFIYELIPQKYIDVEHWQKQNMFLSPDNIILDKLFTAQAMMEKFTDMVDFNLASIAWSALESQITQAETKEAAEKYLQMAFKVGLDLQKKGKK